MLTHIDVFQNFTYSYRGGVVSIRCKYNADSCVLDFDDSIRLGNHIASTPFMGRQMGAARVYLECSWQKVD